MDSKEIKEIYNIWGAVSLKCEGQYNPMAVEALQPSFSWQYLQPGKDKVQSAYRIIVSTSEKLIIGDMWDSGKIDSAKTHMISYEGRPLKSKTRYFWKVNVWDGDLIECEFSESAFFEMGILTAEEWSGTWVGGYDLLRKEFTINQNIGKARAYIACVGYYEFRINGLKVGDQVLAPSHTDFEKRIEYNVYDVTRHITIGNNAI